MSDTLTMQVEMQYDHVAGKTGVAGAPDALAGEVIEVPFSVGARLVAAGYAEPVKEVEEAPEAEETKE